MVFQVVLDLRSFLQLIVLTFKLAILSLELMNYIIIALSEVLNFDLVVCLKFNHNLRIIFYWLYLRFWKLESLVKLLKFCVVTLPLQEFCVISRHLRFKTFLQAPEFCVENGLPVNLGLLLGGLHLFGCGVAGHRVMIVAVSMTLWLIVAVVGAVVLRIPIVGSCVSGRHRWLVTMCLVTIAFSCVLTCSCVQVYRGGAFVNRCLAIYRS